MVVTGVFSIPALQGYDVEVKPTATTLARVTLVLAPQALCQAQCGLCSRWSQQQVHSNSGYCAHALTKRATPFVTVTPTHVSSGNPHESDFKTKASSAVMNSTVMST
jgi:hypothetical protein